MSALGSPALWAAWLTFRRDLRLAFRRLGQLTQPVAFFLIVVTLFPLALSPEPRLLRSIAPGVLWVAALLASLLALESVFRTDLEDGTLEQLVISGQPLALLLMAKTGAHWVVTGLPLVVVAPAVAVSLGVPSEAFGAFVLSLLLGTAVLSLLGAIGAALTLGSRRGSVLMSLLVLPLAIPVLIFGARSTDLAMNDLPPDAGIWLLAALLILGLTLAPFAMAAAVRISLE